MPFYRPDYLDSSATGWYDSDNQATVMKTKIALFDSDASGDSDGAKFSFGTAGQALVSGGDGTTVKWGSAGGLVPLASVSGSGNDYYFFNATIDSTLYSGYKIIVSKYDNNTTSNNLYLYWTTGSYPGGPWENGGECVYTDETGTTSEVRSQSTALCFVAKGESLGLSTATIEVTHNFFQNHVTSQGYYNPSGTTNGVWQSWGKIAENPDHDITGLGFGAASDFAIEAHLYGYLKPS